MSSLCVMTSSREGAPKGLWLFPCLTYSFWWVKNCNTMFFNYHLSYIFQTYQWRHRLNTTSDVEGLKVTSDVTECQRFKKLPVNDSSNSADVILFHFVRDSVVVHDLKVFTFLWNFFVKQVFSFYQDRFWVCLKDIKIIVFFFFFFLFFWPFFGMTIDAPHEIDASNPFFIW